MRPLGQQVSTNCRLRTIGERHRFAQVVGEVGHGVVALIRAEKVGDKFDHALVVIAHAVGFGQDIKVTERQYTPGGAPASHATNGNGGKTILASAQTA